MKDYLPSFEKDFPEWKIAEQEEMGIVEVEVVDIIGTSEKNNQRFQSNWSPVKNENNFRFKGILNFVEKKVSSSKNKDTTFEIGYIHLFFFYNKKIDRNQYYVCMDGNRRIAACYKLNIKKIFAHVTKVKV